MKIIPPASTDNCIEWVGATRMGYGAVKFQGKARQVHRLAYEFAFGEIPAGMFVCHRCDNRRCFNPEHLFLGTRADNMRDASLKWRLTKPRLFGREAEVLAAIKIMTYKRAAETFNVDTRTLFSFVKKYALGRRTLGRSNRYVAT